MGVRVCHLGQKTMPSRRGGVEVVVQELATRQAALGCQVTCYNRRAPGSARPREYKGVRLKYVFTLNFRGLAAATSSVAATLRAAFGRYDVAHFHAEGPSLLCGLPKLLGKRVIVTIHGLDWQRAKWSRLASAYIRGGERAAARWADEVIVLSRDAQEYFLRVYGRETRRIPNGVDVWTPAPVREIRERFGLEKDGYILFLARIVPEKGLRRLIEAFKRVRTDKKLIVAGDDSDTKEFLEEMRALAADDPRIRFVGFAEGRTLNELYSNAYVYALPSDVEGMPLSLMEAMSCGCCCLVSDLPECEEVAGPHGAVFRRDDPDGLRDELQKLCDHPEIVARYRDGCAEFVQSRYSWDEMTRRTLELYEGKP